MNKLEFLSDEFLEEMVKVSTLFAGDRKSVGRERVC